MVNLKAHENSLVQYMPMIYAYAYDSVYCNITGLVISLMYIVG